MPPTAHITCSFGTPSTHYTAEEQARNGALDYDVTVTIGTVEIEGEVTLYRDPNGGMSTCGAPFEGWCSGEIVRIAHSLSDASRKTLLGELASLCGGAYGESKIELSEPTAEQHGASDAECAVSDTLINADGSWTIVRSAANMLRPGSIGPDEALINAMGWPGVYELAWLAYDSDVDHPSPEALDWCQRYNAGYRAKLAEIAAEAELSDPGERALTRAKAEALIRSCGDEGPDSYEEAAEIFSAIFGRPASPDDGDQGTLWSHCCAAVQP